MKYIRWFSDLRLSDIETVGGKNASLGEMISNFGSKVRIPNGFAITAQGYRYHLLYNKLDEKLASIMKSLKDHTDLKMLERVGKQARKLIAHAPLPPLLAQEIVQAYRTLCKKKNCAVAVRSSATAEDLPDASFAGQQDSFLHVVGEKSLLLHCRKAMASLFTNRAIVYRCEKKFDHLSIALSVGVQQMVYADNACAGVLFTLETETGFKDVVVITGSYGLGESVVKGVVDPDEFHVYKGKKLPIISKKLGSKKNKRVYNMRTKRLVTNTVPSNEQRQFCLKDKEILELASMGIAIEQYYTKKKGSWCPMDIEWAKSDEDNKLYIVQARPETVHAQKNSQLLTHYMVRGKHKAKILVVGKSVGQQAIAGKACVVHSPRDMRRVEKGDILVTRMTDPDWVPVMKKAGGIITDRGGRTCHAAIVSRELGIPALVGTEDATKKIKQNQMITLDCSKGAQGIVYDGKLDVLVRKTEIETIKKLPISLLLNIAVPDRAYTLSFLPVDGVGLARLEFIIANDLRIHPMACVDPQKVKDKKTRSEIDRIVEGYRNAKTFFVEKLAQGIAMIATAFYPRPVLVRFSDFKSNEYRNLLGGVYFEPDEENPMIGLRGACRYYSPLYEPAFKLECKAISLVRNEMGFDNVDVMVPFVRTVDEGKRVLGLIKKLGVVKRSSGPKVYMMAELPSNALLIDSFAQIFDGFSIGSNDLTQTTLSIDRDSPLLASLFDERNDAIKELYTRIIKGAHAHKKKVGICGQGPSDYPELGDFLIKQGIDSLSLNADSILPFLRARQ